MRSKFATGYDAKLSVASLSDYCRDNTYHDDDVDFDDYSFGTKNDCWNMEIRCMVSGMCQLNIYSIYVCSVQRAVMAEFNVDEYGAAINNRTTINIIESTLVHRNNANYHHHRVSSINDQSMYNRAHSNDAHHHRYRHHNDYSIRMAIR